MRITTYPFVCLYWGSLLLMLSLLASCSSQRMYHGARANIHLPVQPAEERKEKKEDKKLPSVIDMKDRFGNKTTYVQTEKDQNGNMMASVQLSEVTVTAKMKNVPERFGKVDVDFIVSVPEELVNSKWQLNLTPRLLLDGQLSDFEGLVINGADFRRLQDKQYARYEKYLSRIVPDSLFDKYFLKARAYHRYLDRHNKSEQRRVYKDSMDHAGYLRYKAKLEGRYAFFNEKMYRNRQWLKKQMSFLGIKERYGYFGRDTAYIASVYHRRYYELVDLLPMFHLLRDFSAEHIRHKYRDRKYAYGFENDYDPVTASDSVFLKRMFLKNKPLEKNRRLLGDRHIARALMVTYPRDENARLDTVIYSKGKFEYYYRQQVEAGQDNRMQVFLDGYVQATDGNSWLLPRSDTLEYVVSSMVQLMDTTPRFMRKVIERKAMSTLRANITFKTGKYDMDTGLGDNRMELNKVQELLGKLTGTGELVLDSITLSAGCSPEGSFSSNMLLSKRRGEAIRNYLAGELSGIAGIENMLKPYSKGEDWQGLLSLVRDSLSSQNKQAILDIIANGMNPDKKELEIRSKYPADYRYIRERLYPQLRAVEFTFHVHRAGMLKDIVHTTEPDTVYAKGMELMKKRRYSDALQVLHEYNDCNTAICLMSLGYDVAAYNILVNEADEAGSGAANHEYLLAILASRLGKTEEAVSRYLRSVELDPAKRWRGTLDPEINKLIKAYGLHNDSGPDDDDNN